MGTGFHPELTGRENIFLNGAILGMSRSEIRRKFDEIIAFAEVDRFLDTPVKRYSSGMYVRLAFAIAAHLEPEILIVDEVLAVGDLEFQKKCVGKMKQVAGGGRTVLFVSHNLAAVQNLGLVLLVESNLWAYSTPSEMQYKVTDLAERAIAYGIPSVIIDGTDTCQVYDVAHEAVERAFRGEGPTLIEAKMMRMKGHAIHDAADYVPKPMFDYWRRRDPITRFENYLINVKKWLSAQEHRALLAEIDTYLEQEREFAVNSPMPTPESAEGGVYCEDGCHEIKPKYAMPKVRVGRAPRPPKAQGKRESPLHFK